MGHKLAVVVYIPAQMGFIFHLVLMPRGVDSPLSRRPPSCAGPSHFTHSLLRQSSKLAGNRR